MSLLLLPACDEPDNQSAVSENESTLRPLISLLDELTQQDEQFDAPTRPRFPQDLLPHPQTRAESFSLRAIIYPGNSADTQENSVSAALQATVERIALRGENVNRGAATDPVSRWTFNNVLRANVITDAVTSRVASSSNDTQQTVRGEAETLLALAQYAPRQTVQRAALDLAGSVERRLWVSGDELHINPRSDVEGQCQVDYRWSSRLSADQQIELTFAIDTCPEVLSLTQLATWSKRGIVVRGNLVTNTTAADPINVPVHGLAWIDYSWGDPPTGMGAVIFDTLTLKLNNGDILDLSRSKRTSGTGPVTISATLRNEAGAIREIAIDWEDVDVHQSASGQAYPHAIRIRSEDASLDGTVTLMNRVQESAGFGGNSLSVAVNFQAENDSKNKGRMQGVGFLSYTPIPASP